MIECRPDGTQSPVKTALASGAIIDGAHVFPCRVYYEDTDAAGIVYYANYLHFAERGRTEMLRLMGVDHPAFMGETATHFAVRACTVDYLSPARLDDALEVHTRAIKIGGASLRLAQTIRRDDTDLVAMTVRLACIRPDGRPGRLPAGLRAAFQTMNHP
jgi:acyl-CoA thioester hydrolase